MTDPLPRLDLAPKLKRPLSLWNPLDYLRLLYWVFYFPQALRWYVDECVSSDIISGNRRESSTVHPLNNGSKLKLLLQGLVFLFFLLFFSLFFLNRYDQNINFFSIIEGFIAGFFGGVLGFIFFDYSSGFLLAIMLATVCCFVASFSEATNCFIEGSLFGLLSRIAFLQAESLLEVIILSSSGVMLISLMLGIAFNINEARNSFVLEGISFGLVFNVLETRKSRIVFHPLSGLAISLGASFVTALIFGFWEGLILSISAGLTILRLDDWIMGIFTKLISKDLFVFCHVTLLPSPLLKKELENHFLEDWESASGNANELIGYTFQSYMTFDVLNDVIKKQNNESIRKISILSINPFVCESLCFLSSEISQNFYLLWVKDIQKALKEFELMREMPDGEEMYTLTQALHLCTQAQEFNQIYPLQLPSCPELDPTKRLRQTSWLALEAFHRVTQDAQLIHQSRSKTTQSIALNRALGELKTILDTQDQLPQAEGGLIVDIATTWRDALLSIASEIGTIEITEAITIPYTIGDPVEGQQFVGREDILRELRSLWLRDNPTSVLVFGHRRMGKTSILRNFAQETDPKLIYVNLQLLGSVSQGFSEVLLAIADDIAQHLKIPVPPDDAFLNFPQRTFERYLRDVLANLNCRALIIALDEFEIIEDLIESGQLQPDFMGYLRGLIQMDKRLAFALAGLHTLEEMTRDYFEPFFGSTYGIPVSFLTEAASRQILENPSDDFPLEYEPQAVDEVYRLTHGQPYLVQLIGFQLVRHFNEQVFETGKERDPRLTVADVAAVIHCSQADLFRNGRYYFEGVWKQAAQGAPGQHAILIALAPHPEGLALAELQAQLPEIDDLPAALDTLRRHDAVAHQQERYAIRVELFRLWCCQRVED